MNTLNMNKEYYDEFLKQKEEAQNQNQQLINSKKQVKQEIERLNNCAGIKVSRIPYVIFGVVSLGKIYSQCKHLNVDYLFCKLDKDKRQCNQISGYKKLFGIVPSFKCNYREMTDGEDVWIKFSTLKKVLET